MKNSFYFLLLFLSLISCEEQIEPEQQQQQQDDPRVSFYLSEDLGVGTIDVRLNGSYIGTIDNYYSSGVACNQAEITVPVQSGIHTYTATAFDGTTWSGTIQVGNTCELIHLTTQNANPGGGNQGGSEPELSFWIRSDFGTGYIDVTIDGTFAGTITTFYSNGIVCGEGSVNKMVSSGTHSWSAQAEDGSTWSGTVNVSECYAIELTSNGSGGGSNTDPELSFFITQDLGVGTIDVSIDGSYVGTISSFQANGVPCGQADVNQLVSEGNHSWSATAQDGSTWSGTTYVDECELIELTGSGGGGNDCENLVTSVSATNIIYGDACGSNTSARLFWTNPYNTTYRVLFRVIDEDGNWSGQVPYQVDPGETKNQHFCYPKYVNNQICYSVMITEASTGCDFPDLNPCAGF